MLEQCWGQQGHPCPSHISILRLSLFPDHRDRHPCASKATGAWDGDPAGRDAPVHACNDREGSLLSGAEKPTAPQAVPRPGFEHPPLLHTQDHTPPRQPRGSFPLPGALLLLISLPRTFRREQGRGASPRSLGPEPPSDRKAILGCLFVPKDPVC